MAVIEDDGFLPEDVTSVYGFFLGNFTNAPGGLGRSRYFNEIKVPDYWEISGTNNSGKVNDLYRVRGRIFYAEPLHKRRVKVVDWYDERETVRSSDHYNRYGVLYARTIFNAKGQKVNKSYFDGDGREVIVENFVTHDIILNEDGKVKIFRNKTEFVVHFLERAGWTERRIFFNSLSTPFLYRNGCNRWLIREIFCFGRSLLMTKFLVTCRLFYGDKVPVPDRFWSRRRILMKNS